MTTRRELLAGVAALPLLPYAAPSTLSFQGVPLLCDGGMDLGAVAQRLDRDHNRTPPGAQDHNRAGARR